MCLSKSLLLTLSTIALSLGLFSCSHNVHHSDMVYAYGTFWEVHLYEGKDEDLDEICDYIAETSRVLDLEASSVEDGLYALNHLGQVNAHPFLIDALSLALEMEKLTHGAFSYAVGDLTASWLDALGHGVLLEEEIVGDLLQKSRQTSIKIENESVIKTGEATIDLGALGKGLCLKKLKAKLDQKGFTKYLINAGTSSILFGENTSKSGETRVEIDDAPGRCFYAKNGALSVSSNSRQSYIIDEWTYSHIIDPRDGYPANNVDAVLLYGDDAAKLDALSTAYFVLGEEYASELENMGYHVAMCKGGKVIYESAGFLE